MAESALRAKTDVVLHIAVRGAVPAGLFDAILQVLTYLVGMFKDSCDVTPAEAVSRFHTPTAFNRLQVRRACVRHLGRKELRGYQGRVEDGVFEAARHTTPDEMAQMYAEVGQSGGTAAGEE